MAIQGNDDRYWVFRKNIMGGWPWECVDVTGMLLAWLVEHFNNGEECTEDASRHETSFLLQHS